MNCLQCFISKEVLTNHAKVCLEIWVEQGVNMPKRRSKIQFTNYHKKLRTLFVIYADL